MGFFDKIKQGLSRTASSISSVFTASELDDDFFDELEESLILADLGVETTDKAVTQLRALVKERHLKTADEAREALREVLVQMLNVGSPHLALETKPSVVLVIGVNGVGKTTTIGKLGAKLTGEGKKVLFAAADTFRAAAADQLTIWAGRAGADIVRHNEGADPSAVIYDAVTAARARGCDVVICDTAGRLHNKQNLMNELEKMNRVIHRELPEASAETLLVLDATTGQNAISQAEGFNSVTALTGLVITKLDGTAKGGIAIHVSADLRVPVKYIGVGEQVDDLLEFDSYAFTKAFFESANA